MDKDGNGYLEGDELNALVDLVYSSYALFAKVVSQQEKESMKRRILQKCDLSEQGVLFLSDIAELLVNAAEEKALREASKLKFKEFDADNSGYLDLKEIQGVAGALNNDVLRYESRIH